MPDTATVGNARRLGDDLWLLDTLHQGEPGVIASYLLEGDDGLALIDVGPAATADHVMAGIRAAGHDVRDVRHLILTHVHLDHAGAAGLLAAMSPEARVYVHPRGAPHIVDPSKLVASAARIYGDQMEALWGITIPVPVDRVIMLQDADAIHVGRRALVALHTPGHAVHHVALYDPVRREVFAGDVAGVRLEGTQYVRPPTPPPDLSLEDWSASLARLRALRLKRLFLPHFGVDEGVEMDLQALETRLYGWGEVVLNGMRLGHDARALACDLAATGEQELADAGDGVNPDVRRRYELATGYLMSAQGYERYYRKRHPELV